MSIPGMLLMIGYLTAPTSITGVSLSEFWAWLRYVGAFTADDDMRLTSGFTGLDAHQKTILSDDFGMGVPMLWLGHRLSFDEIVDGRYFIKYVAASIGASARRTAKRGPNKSPDFVARDSSGVWHVVECKGTQSGPGYSGSQMAHGAVQKQSIIFPPAYTGQRLVCGLNIAVHDSQFETSLTVADPEPDLEDPFEIGPSNLTAADDAAIRGVVSKSLRLAGFEAVAETMSAPFGLSPTDRPSKFSRREDTRARIVEERDLLARAELDSFQDRPILPEFSGRFRGRRLSIDLPRPIFVRERKILRATVVQGINEDVLSEMRERPTIDVPLPETEVQWRSALGRTSVIAEDETAVMKIGELFRSEIILS